MSKLLRRLLSFLFPGVDDIDPPADDPPADDEIEFDFAEPTPPARRSPPDADRIAALERTVEDARRQADEMRRAAPAPAPTDRDFEREEERLRNPDTTELERWQIQSNRTMRQSQQAAAHALFQAQDLNDRTAFESKFSSDPHRSRYRDRVEQAVQSERAQGRNVSREAVYYHMLGKDIAEGKLKPKAKAKAPAADIPRGKSPNVRPNVPSGRGQTDHQKRAARLEGVNI
ncbi:hypothetical protein C7399_109190 [Paraburkholderia tropica]|uniref:Phage protein n=1 Tax=Paraburkholderia tropica TaxID=92647 RepID=A0ABX5MNQ9_9BURK|nr:hypothetical protein [Paraburkholderia tropica]PXX15855.1 hypothetical protein C7400_109190 [Paraburkholderia tropica]PZW82114.1 hypothetical protein C7399_109190 [Paraburkholderia tropica]